MKTTVKREPTSQRPKWSLIAVSEAARKHKNIFVLATNTEYSVGRSRSNDIHIPSQFCSKVHCVLQVTDMEIILKDNSARGTYINALSYKDSRSILSQGDLLGFGCKTKSQHIKDARDGKYFVYRLEIGNYLESCGTIDLCDDSDDDNIENNRNHSVPIASFNDSHETDDEHDSADEIDVKPDIHTLMRTAYQQMKIKEEIGWNIYEYEKTTNNGNGDDETNWNNIESVELSSDEDCIADEPSQKRQRHEEPDYLFDAQEQIYSTQTSIINSNSANGDNEMDSTSFHSTDDQPDVAPEYQMSDAILKEKVKNAARSRGQQLAHDLLMSQNARPNQNNSIVTSKQSASIEDLTNEFISEITRWEFQWIAKEELSPSQLRKNIRQLGIDFDDLATFQRQMKNLLFLEVYSVFLKSYDSIKKRTFTSLKSCEFDTDRNRFVYQCSTTNKDCRGESVNSGYFAIVTHSAPRVGQFLAYVTKSQKTNDGWEFEMQASKTDNNKINITSKYVQVTFVTSVKDALECFISLYLLDKSSLQDVFLRPFTQIDDYNPDDDYDKTDWASILSKVYEKCAVSVLGGSKILLVNGGAGTGKTTFIRHLLEEFSKETFQITNSILVCGMNGTLVDQMAAKSKSIIPNIARFGKLTAMDESVRDIGVEMFDPKLKTVNIVFSALDNAVHLLHAGRNFDVCIVDDASLCCEADLLSLFRLQFNTLLLVGDEKLQTTKTENECCRENGYSRSLFTRVIESYRKFDGQRTLFPTLNQQRRMNAEISLWPNNYFYKKQMIALSKQYRRTQFKPYTVFQVNTIEDIEIEFLKQLLEQCFKVNKQMKCTYGIICGDPSSQPQIEEMLKTNAKFSNVEVKTFDLFQGQEKDVIIISAMKPLHGFTLFGTKENLMTALTRAKESLIVCGNFQYVCTNSTSAPSAWFSTLLGDAKLRHRFFDTNGTFEPRQICHAIA